VPYMATINVTADATVMSGSEVAKIHTRDEPNTLRHMGCVAIDSGGLLLR
jgi:Xaa-Pro aminopeptidase